MDNLRTKIRLNIAFCPDLKLCLSPITFPYSMLISWVVLEWTEELTAAFDWLGLTWHHKQDGSTCTQLLVASLKLPVTWQWDKRFILISCYLVWNKHGGPENANSLQVMNASLCMCHPLSHSITKSARWLRLWRNAFLQAPVCNTQSEMHTFS